MRKTLSAIEALEVAIGLLRQAMAGDGVGRVELQILEEARDAHRRNELADAAHRDEIRRASAERRAAACQVETRYGAELGAEATVPEFDLPRAA